MFSFSKPPILLVEAVLESDPRVEVEIAAGGRRIGVGVAHVAFLLRFTLNGNRLSGHLPNQIEHVVQRDPRATTNIVYAARTPLGGRRHVRGDDVRHKSEVA